MLRIERRYSLFPILVRFRRRPRNQSEQVEVMRIVSIENGFVVEHYLEQRLGTGPVTYATGPVESSRITSSTETIVPKKECR